MRMDVILRVTAKLFIPFMLIFGLYVQLHGDFGPGGGFQAGVIIAAAIILYGIIWGQGARRRASYRFGWSNFSCRWACSFSRVSALRAS